MDASRRLSLFLLAALLFSGCHQRTKSEAEARSAFAATSGVSRPAGAGAMGSRIMPLHPMTGLMTFAISLPLIFWIGGPAQSSRRT